jgi:protein Tex
MADTTDARQTRDRRAIADEMGCRPAQVSAATDLLDDGATVPFIARYRKEATGGLTDAQLEELAKLHAYYADLTQRRDAILASLTEQGVLRDSLAAAIDAAKSKQELEDIYLPYRPRRRTRAQAARERGLEPLADALFLAMTSSKRPAELARPYVSEAKDVGDADAALAGARDILAERVSESSENRAKLRDFMQREGVVTVRVVKGKEDDARVYADYFEYRERASRAASHRLLAIYRGERDGLLATSLDIDDDRVLTGLGRGWDVNPRSPCGAEVMDAVADGYKRLLRPSITNEMHADLRLRAETEAIAVFRANLEALLMQAPFGRLPVMGIDPGYRTGSKIAVVDAVGRVVETGVIYPGRSDREDVEAADKTAKAVARHGVRAVAIGNGTGSREAESFARQALADAEDVLVAVVPETGASVYSASEIAREELPTLDVTIRGAVSIARRIQDPLAELVKIDPKALGVGQYQHDVDQKRLQGELDAAVEKVTNQVGVELNMASAPLLRRVSGLSSRVATEIVNQRDANGPFRTRRELLKVPRLGAKAYEQAAGFLRIRDAANALDDTAVHPERYGVVEDMARALGVKTKELVGAPHLAATLDLSQFADEGKQLGLFTLEDIRDELSRPGRDPRPDFQTAETRDDVTSIDDVEPGMTLEGRVTNVTNFGAFVDIGVKRDGLVHLSELSDDWVDDPHQVVQVGQIVTAVVVDVDRERERIGLSMKLVGAGD